MRLLYFFEKLRMPWLDSVMMVITQFGGEILFLAMAIGAFWCVSKRLGYYMLTVGFIGTTLNQALKLIFRISRPWVQDPEFTIVEAARADAGGYSFPSGHTQNAAAVMLCPALMARKKWLKAVLWTLYFLVALSRMYLGVHTPLDVGVSIVIGLALVFILRPLFNDPDLPARRMVPLMAALIVMAVIYVIYTNCWKFPADIETENLEEGVKNGYSLLGAILAMPLGYWLDKKYIHFKTEGSLPAQIVKLVFGLALTVGLRIVLKAPLNALMGGGYAANAVRYFLMTTFAMAVWPLTFPWINRMLPRK